MRRTAFALSPSVRNQAFTGESGNRKLAIRKWKKGLRVVRGVYKNDIAVIRVSVPVMIISLAKVSVSVRCKSCSYHCHG